MVDVFAEDAAYATIKLCDLDRCVGTQYVMVSFSTDEVFIRLLSISTILINHLTNKKFAFIILFAVLFRVYNRLQMMATDGGVLIRVLVWIDVPTK